MSVPTWRARALLVLSVSLASPSAADDSPSHAAGSTPIGHAPIGVMGDHMHDAGEVMVSYRYSRMGMSGNRDGTSRESDAEVLRQFPVAPTDMDMEMHMVGAMWAPIDAVTLTAMLPFIRLSMDHVTRSGVEFTTRSTGIGDFKFGGLFRLWEIEHHEFHANFAVSAPTGSISKRDDTPAGDVRLPYPMQLGSGTWDVLPGLTYTGTCERWGWGAQAMGTIRIGENSRDYTLGNRWNTTGWIQREFLPWLSASFRADYQQWYDIDGADPGLNPAMVPTADPDLRAGRRLDLLLGLNFLVTGGPLKGHRFAIEGGAPVYQYLDGPQLETDWRVTAGWQLTF